MSSPYKDSLHQLVRPIIITHNLKNKKEIRKSITELHKAVRQEEIWSKSAYDEYVSEKERGLKLPRGDPFRNELLWDAKVALDFYKMRMKRSSMMKKLAAKLEEKYKRMK
jgi:hypothetical protein